MLSVQALYDADAKKQSMTTNYIFKNVFEEILMCTVLVFDQVAFMFTFLSSCELGVDVPIYLRSGM